MANITEKATEALARILDVYYNLAYKQDLRETLEWLMPNLLVFALAVTAALLPIYTGAWASLRRPSSAAKIPESDEDEDDSDDNEMETVGFEPWDILRIPLSAGFTLTALYYLLKYMDDPQLLSKILSWLFALSGTMATTFLIADTVRVAHKLWFPTYYAHRGGIWFVDASKREVRLVGDNEKRIGAKFTPLPGFLSEIPLPAFLSNTLWNIRQVPLKKLVFKFSIHKVLADKTVVDPIDLFGILTATVIMLFWLLNSRPWYISNVIGVAVSYFSVQAISPTSFRLASLVMGALLIYDVVMVYYTPMMVHVARNLDIPAKLVLPHKSATDPSKIEFSVLGLGDIALPGIVIALALRFDLHMAYVCRHKAISTGSKADQDDDQSKEVDTHKPYFIPYHKHWHNRLWTWSYKNGNLPVFSRFHFPTPYFWATVISYPISMLACFTVMWVYDHGQPALFYIVPGLLIAIWGVAIIRGEVKDVFNFHEDFVEAEQKENEIKIKAENAKREKDNIDKETPAAEEDVAVGQETSWENGNTSLSTPDSPEAKSTVQINHAEKAETGGNVLALESKLKRDADLDIVYLGVSMKAPKPEVEFSNLLDENAVLEGYSFSGVKQLNGNGNGSRSSEHSLDIGSGQLYQKQVVHVDDEGHASKRSRVL